MPTTSTILLWRLGALGDSLLLLPALAALRSALPGGRIVVAGRPTVLEPARWAGLADDILDASSAPFAPLSSGLPPVPGLLPDALGAAVVWSGQHETVARGLRVAGVPHVISAPALPPASAALPIGEYYLHTIAPLGARPVPFTLRAPDDALARTESVWQATCGEADLVALLHPGAGSPLKRWPLDHYCALARRLRADGVATAWTTGPEDEDVRAALQDAGEGDALFPPLALADLAAMLSRAAVMVSGDCGVTHLAALLDVPGVALFGPTDLRLWGPPGPRTTVVHLALPCAPCWPDARYCPSRMCLRGLPPRAVYRAVRNRLDRVGDDEVTQPAVAGRMDMGWHRGPWRPSEYRPRAPAPAPAGALRVATWAGARNWEARPSIAPG